MIDLLLEASTLNLDQATGFPDRFLVLLVSMGGFWHRN
jgi:hypothetical protein